MGYVIQKGRYMYLLLNILTLNLLGISLALADTVKIDFTADDSYSLEVAKINVGDTIEWIPKNKGHNVEFLAGPNMKALPKKSDLDVRHSITFYLPGIYLYQCTPHGNMGMLGIIIVDNNFDNMDSVENVELSPVAKSVLQRLIRKAKKKK